MELLHCPGVFLRQAKEVPLEYFSDEEWRQSLGRIVLVTGSYDLLTPHHFQFIRRCARLEPDLTCVLAIDSDDYVQRRKGPLRPIIPFIARRDSLAELDCVNWIIEHEGDNDTLIRTVRPEIFTMSYSTEQESPESRIQDISAVESVGGKVAVLPGAVSYLIGEESERMSTSGIIRTIVARYGQPSLFLERRKITNNANY